jgi:hypothetical protein
VNQYRKLAGIGAAIVVVIAGGMAWASIPDASGVIHGCVKDGTTGRREVRVIDTAYTTTCGAGWTEVTWNQEGPQGPAGATGLQGPAGATGPAGAPGEQRYYQVRIEDLSIPGPAGSAGSGGVVCDEGDRAVSGGYIFTSGSVLDRTTITATYLYVENNSFSFSFLRDYDVTNAGAVGLDVRALCADFPPYRS